MPKKKVVRKPVEKLSYKEEVVEIMESESDTDSDTDTEEVIQVKRPAPKKPAVKKERTAAQKAATARMLAAKAKKKEVKMDTTLHNGEPVKPAPPVVEEDDKPLTMRQYKALMKEKAEKEVPADTKPKRKYTKRTKPQAPPPTPTPSPQPQQVPSMIFV
jgi:hypothetical protein